MDGHPTAAVLARLEAGETVPAAEVQSVDHGDAFGGTTLGLVFDDFSLDRVTAHLDVDVRHHQPYGIVHGGVWCAIVESVASTAAMLRVASSGRLVVGVSNTTDFLRAVRDGRVDAVATPIHVGRTQQLWQVELSRAVDGKTVARGQVRLQNIDATQVAGA